MESVMEAAKEVEPQTRKRKSKSRSSLLPGDLEEATELNQVLSSGNSKKLAEYLENNTKIQKEMLQWLNKPDGLKPAKRARESEPDEIEGDLNDKSWQIIEEEHVVSDNGVDKFCWALRSRFRPPNASPSEWWKSAAFDSRLAVPRRGNTLYLEHITGGQRYEYTYDN